MTGADGVNTVASDISTRRERAVGRAAGTEPAATAQQKQCTHNAHKNR